MALRQSIDIQFTGTVTLNGQTFTGTNVFEGFKVVKHHNGDDDDRHHDDGASDEHENHHHGVDVVHISEVEAMGSETNLLTRPVTLTGVAADNLLHQLSGGTTVPPDADDHGHS
jgi:hypothetical protein